MTKADRQKQDIMGGPKKQLNLRMRLTLRDEIRKLADARGIEPTQAALGLLEEAIVNKCPRCHFGLAPGSTILHPKPCLFCFGTGRLDQARAHRRAAKLNRRLVKPRR
jgi:hypothetical protein